MTGTYDQWNTQGLWEMVADENDDHAATHIHAWRVKQDLLDDQASKLSALRDQLAQHWDPAGSPAAQAFLDRIDAMLQLVQYNSGAAAAVRQTYEQVTTAIHDAREQLKPLIDRYNDRQAAWESQSWFGRLDIWDKNSPNVLTHYHGEVDKRARAVMEQMDHRIADATATPANVQTFDQWTTGGETQVSLATDNSGGPAGSDGSSGSSRPSSIAQPTFNPPPAWQPAISELPDPSGTDNAPVLAGTPSPPATFPAPPASPAVISAPPLGGPPVPVPSSTALRPPSGLVPSEERLLRAPSSRFGGVIGEPAGRPFSGSLRQSAVPTDGVIRGGPASPMAGGSASRTSSARGGLTRRTTRTAQVTEAHGEAVSRSGGARGWQDSSYEAYAKRRAKRKDDPDNQWTVEEGVAPVLEAPSDPDDHSATPGVIGLDR
ncbi:hypothetical protein [Dactylosporangium sp. CA-139066]|uniref:hypothetical protein n=1 Tax=Dactylosporangium sp. CA-139066 TaxID=3239930 RepID=UPI003D92C36C